MGTRKGKGEPARKNGVRSIADLVGSAGGPAFRRFGFVQHSVVTRWPEIVGERYARVSAPEAIRFPIGKKSQGVLALVVEGAHVTIIQHVAPTIIERVNRFFGYPAIDRVTFRQGRVVPPALRLQPAERPAPLSEEVGESLRAVADPELHAVLESLARSLAAAENAPAATAIPVLGRIGDDKR